MSEIIANDQDLSLTNIHSSELEEIKKIKSASQMMSLFGKKKIILISQEEAFEVAYRMALKSVIESLGEATSIPHSLLKEEAQAALDDLENT